jgi:hypothetical protein
MYVRKTRTAETVMARTVRPERRHGDVGRINDRAIAVFGLELSVFVDDEESAFAIPLNAGDRRIIAGRPVDPDGDDGDTVLRSIGLDGMRCRRETEGRERRGIVKDMLALIGANLVKIKRLVFRTNPCNRAPVKNDRADQEREKAGQDI